MHFKIIETGTNLPDVLLFRDVDDDGQESVKIMAVGVVDEYDDQIIVEKVEFTNRWSAISFIKDFSLPSANNWCEKNKIKYSYPFS